MAATVANTIQALTKRYFIPKVFDQITQTNAAYYRMQKKGTIKIDGGERIVAPVRIDTISASSWFSGTDALSITPNETNLAYEWDWKRAYASIILTGEDYDKNVGSKEAVINLAKEKTENAKETLAKVLGEGIYNDGTSNVKAIEGLRLAASDAGTYGMIDRASYSWAQGNVDSTSTTVTLALIYGAISTVHKNKGTATVIYTTHEIYDRIHNLIAPQQRHVDSKMADAGFKSIMVKGIPVIPDSYCPANHLFVVDDDVMKFYVNKNRNMDVGPFVEDTDKDIKVSKVIHSCALVYTNPRQSYMFTNLTA